MTTLDVPAPEAGAPAEPLTHASGWSAFKALLTRDAYVLAHNLKEFLPRTLIQPFLLVFVFTYVLPKVGLGIGSSSLPPAILQLMPPAKLAAYHATAAVQAAAYSASLIAGVIGSVILFQGIQAVALPLVQEFGYTREIEDRVLAPLPVELVALEKIVAGAIQCMIAGLLVFPIAAIVPATAVHLHIHWWILLTIMPLACLMASTLGLTFGTIFDPAHGADAVRRDRHPDHLPGLHLLPVVEAERHPVAQGGVAGQPARVHQRRLPGRADRRSRT